MDKPKNYRGCRNCKNRTGELTLCEKGKGLTVYYPVCPFWEEAEKGQEQVKEALGREK